MHALAGSPSTRTVHAPQTPSPQAKRTFRDAADRDPRLDDLAVRDTHHRRRRDQREVAGPARDLQEPPSPAGSEDRYLDRRKEFIVGEGGREVRLVELVRGDGAR